MFIKIKHIVIIMLAICVLGIIYLIISKPVNEFLTKRKYEKQIVNFLNFKSFDNVSDVSIKRYNYYKNYYNEPNIDISPLIESYIKQVETNEYNNIHGEFWVELSSTMEREIEGLDFRYVAQLYHGIDRKLSIEDLERVLVHTSKDKYSGWCIPKDSPNIIELPYNFYLKYEPSDFKLLDSVKEITKCSFKDTITKYSYQGEKGIEVEYIDTNNNIQVVNDYVYINDDNGKFIIDLYGLYYTQTHNAHIELCNHDYDEWKIIKEKEEENEPWNWHD